MPKWQWCSVTLLKFKYEESSTKDKLLRINSHYTYTKIVDFRMHMSLLRVISAKLCLSSQRGEPGRYISGHRVYGMYSRKEMFIREK
jgi:hypothetical protein